MLWRFFCVNTSVSQAAVCTSLVRLMLFCAKDCALTVRSFWRAEKLRWVEMNFFPCSDEMKTVEKNLLRWHVKRDGMRWEELRWGDMRWEEIRWFEMRWDEVWSVKCVVWSAGCEKCSVKCEENVRLALHCNVMAHRSCSWTTTQQQARTHAWTTTPGGRTAHASSIDEKGLIVKSKATSAPPRAGTTGNHYSSLLITLLITGG